ncbi:hypothetical protein GCM10009850_047640 [Nonomuraea monospora]|uniref:Uncharacterized protein n=2 Tax=Nonomuraea monospora TaxID=568818 RepID=A0ABN3CIN8_9ACTN
MVKVKVWSEKDFTEVDMPADAAAWVLNEWLAAHNSDELLEVADVMSGGQ